MTDQEREVLTALKEMRKLHMSLNVCFRQHGAEYLPACDGPDCKICESLAAIAKAESAPPVLRQENKVSQPHEGWTVDIAAELNRLGHNIWARGNEYAGDRLGKIATQLLNRTGCDCKCCDHSEGVDCACDCHTAGRCSFQPLASSVAAAPAWQGMEELMDAYVQLRYWWNSTGSCPCGARREAPKTHPHVGGCPTEAALRAAGDTDK